MLHLRKSPCRLELPSLRSGAHLALWSGNTGGRSTTLGLLLPFLREGLAQLALLLLGKVGRDDLEVVLLELVDDLVGCRRPTGQSKQRRGSLRDLLANLPYEVVVDAHVGQRACHPAHAGADRSAKERHEEDQPEQETPEGAPARASSSSAVQLAGLRLPVALGPADYSRVLQGDHLALLHALQGHQDPVCSVGVVELQYR